MIENKNHVNFVAYSATLHKDVGSMRKSENSRRISILKNITEASKVQYTSDTGYF